MQPNPQWRGDPTYLPELLKLWGVTVKELPGWRDWGNGDFDKLQGVVCHHTGTNNTSAEYIARNPMLDNALSSQIHLARDGVATICGAGIAWHAGRGSYPGWPTDAANWVSIGIEAVSDGRTPWPDAQMVAYRKICAAILWFNGLNATTLHLIGHKEYSGKAQGKWDPGGIDMNQFRREVQWWIDNPPFFKKGNAGMQLDDFVKTFVPRSEFQDKLGNFILHADKNSYLSWQNTAKILEELAAIRKQNEQIISLLETKK